MWRETTKHERNMRIWHEELDEFVPEKVLDFHVHVFCEGVLAEGETMSCAGHDIVKYDLDDLRQDLSELYPGRETSAVCFGFPNVGNDKELNDRYVAEQCDNARFFPLRLFDPLNDTPEKVERDFEENAFLGFKPYLNYVRKADPNDVEIHEMMPDWAMKIADERGLIVMLHIPRKQRLADPLNQSQIVELCKRYPNAKIVLAHVGRAYYVKNVVGYLDRLKVLPNLWYDLAMLNNWEVLEYLFKTAPAERILYGTDIPIAVAPGKSVEINDQYTYVTPAPWRLSISDDHEKLVFTSFLYEELRAIKKAVARTGHSRKFVRQLFYDNGMALLKDTMQSGGKI